MSRIFVAVALMLVNVLALSAIGAGAASGADGPNVGQAGNAFVVETTKNQPGTSRPGSSTQGSGSHSSGPIYEWRTGCGGSSHNVQGGSDPVCGGSCPTGEIYMVRWQVSPPPVHSTPASACMTPGQAAAASRPQVTPAMVSQAFSRLPMPSFRSRVQPANKTLVNFDTIFYTTARPFSRDITLLGQTVHLRITPSRFTWDHGDGTTAVTDSPGAKYPAKEIVHRYQDAHVTVRHHLSIRWSARWRLAGGSWQDVNGTATSTGPTSALRISEAVPVLTGQGH